MAGRGASPRRADLAAVGRLCLGVLVFSLQDVIVKAISGAYPVHEIVVVRCLVALPILLVMLRPAGGLRAVISPRAGWLALRGLALAVAVTAYYLAFPVMRLADVLALYATVPLFVTCLAGPTLGERVGARRWAAVGVGFLGALVMLRPGAGVFEPASLLPVLAAATYAAAQLMARRLGAAEPATVMAFHQNLMFLAAAAVLALAVAISGGTTGHGHPSLGFLLRPWVAPGWRDLLLMATCGPIAALATVLLTQAYRRAEANLVAPFEYTGLVWATLWGYALWGEVPGPASLAGGALIVAAGLYLVSTGPRARPVAQGTDALADRGRAVRAPS